MKVINSGYLKYIQNFYNYLSKIRAKSVDVSGSVYKEIRNHLVDVFNPCSSLSIIRKHSDPTRIFVGHLILENNEAAEFYVKRKK